MCVCSTKIICECWKILWIVKNCFPWWQRIFECMAKWISSKEYTWPFKRMCWMFRWASYQIKHLSKNELGNAPNLYYSWHFCCDSFNIQAICDASMHFVRRTIEIDVWLLFLVLYSLMLQAAKNKCRSETKRLEISIPLIETNYEWILGMQYPAWRLTTTIVVHVSFWWGMKVFLCCSLNKCILAFILS